MSRGYVRRFQLVAVVAVVGASVPYLWVLWDLWTGSIDPLRSDESKIAPGSVIYDVQARALIHGHLALPPNSIGDEAFIHHGRTYTYFGLFPSLIRMPILLVTHALDGRLAGLSLLAAWVVTALFVCLLLWRVRVVIRGDVPLGWAEAVSYGFVVFSVLAGSVLVSLASTPNAYVEDEAWGVALACGSFFALLGVVERPSWGRVTTCGVLVLLTNLNRGTSGYGCILATILLAVWFALARAGAERKRWAVPVLGAGLVAVVAGSAIDYAKFNIFFGYPVSQQLLYKVYGFAHINGGKHYSLHFLPSHAAGLSLTGRPPGHVGVPLSHGPRAPQPAHRPHPALQPRELGQRPGIDASAVRRGDMGCHQRLCPAPSPHGAFAPRPAPGRRGDRRRHADLRDDLRTVPR